MATVATLNGVLVPLTNGGFALVDEADADRVLSRTWYWRKPNPTSRTVYAYSTKMAVPMHRFILGDEAGPVTDHKDGNGMNNTRHNLRPCNHAQNQCNRQPKANGSSRFKGVSWHKRAAKWVAIIRQHGVTHHLGTFANEEDAARAYDAEAIIRFGDFARPNFPILTPSPAG